MSTRGSVKQDTHGWYLVVDIPSPDGRRRQLRRRGFKTKRDAQAALVQVLGDLAHGTFVHPARTTVASYLDEWLASLPARGRRHSTVANYRSTLARHVQPSIGYVELQRLTPLHLDRLYAQMSRPGPDGRMLAKRTIRLVHTIIGKALADAERSGLVQRNVARLASPPAASATRAPEMHVWTPTELRVFLEAAARHEYYVLFRVAAMTGLRRGELCGLRWSALDVDMGRLTVSRTLLCVHGQLIESEPKTARGRRVVDLDPVTVAALREHRKDQVEERLLVGAGYQDGGYVFARPDGEPWNPERISSGFDRLVVMTGVPRIRFHDLRHTHATHLLTAGTNVRVVSERLGHASVAFTLDVYAHALPGQQATAAAAAAALVDGP